MKKHREAIITGLCTCASLVFVVALWEFAGQAGWRIARICPPPSHFLGDLYENDFKVGLGSQAASIQKSIISSIWRVTAGLVLGFAGSLVVGFSVSMSIWVKRFTLLIVQVLAPIAPIAWIPIALVMLGIGNQTAIVLVFMGVFFTLTIATIHAIERVPARLRDAARSLGASPAQIWLYVVLPHILPSVFIGLRLNFIGAWMAVLAAEMTGLNDGLGNIVMVGRNLFNNDLKVLGMCLIGIVGFFGDLCLRGAQRLCFWWGDA
jgi:NitT/TauT family transport system permease protein